MVFSLDMVKKRRQKPLTTERSSWSLTFSDYWQMYYFPCFAFDKNHPDMWYDLGGGHRVFIERVSLLGGFTAGFMVNFFLCSESWKKSVLDNKRKLMRFVSHLYFPTFYLSHVQSMASLLLQWFILLRYFKHYIHVSLLGFMESSGFGNSIKCNNSSCFWLVSWHDGSIPNAD